MVFYTPPLFSLLTFSLEIENTKNTPKATRYQSIFEATRLISYALITIYMGLSFFQKPSWCRGDPVYNPETNTYTVIE